MHMYAQVLRVLEVSLQHSEAHMFMRRPRFHARVLSTQTRGGLVCQQHRFRAHVPMTRTRGGWPLMEQQAPHAAS